MENMASHERSCVFSLLFLIVLLLLGCSAMASSAPFKQTCSSESDTCPSYVAYSYTMGVELQLVADLFSVKPMDIFQANGIDVPDLAEAGRAIFSTNLTLRIPLTCACVSNLHSINSVSYTVKPGDDLSMIAGTIFGGLITYQEIAAVNSILDPTKIFPGQKFLIPLPCSCLNSTTLNGPPPVSMAYVVSKGDTLDGIAAKTDSQPAQIASLNALNNSVVILGDVLDIPIPACASSFNKGAADYELTVTRGSYKLTANKCVLCFCGPAATNLSCIPAPVSSSCPKLTCAGSNLLIGGTMDQLSHTGCSVTSCVYQGYSGNEIYSSLQTVEEPSCPAPLHAPPFAQVPFGPPIQAPAPAPSASQPASTFTPPAPGSSTLTSPPPGSPAPSFGLVCHESTTFVVMVTMLAFFLSSQF